MNIIEKKINQYITLKMENGRTHIYVNGHRFIQCIRLILNIQRNDAHIYDEIESIDEAAKLYSTHLFQNRILQRPRMPAFPSQGHGITPEQEFWGHCSNIQAWVEHDYDTRVLMSNISFPLLRVLSEAGDPLAKKVFKEEIALRLESGYPSVVQYLINQGYIKHFTPSEFKTILESTNLIKNLLSEPMSLNGFLVLCISRFSTYLKDILLEILKQPKGKTKLISSLSLKPGFSYARPYMRFNPRLLSSIKRALEDLLMQADENMHDDIIECVNVIEKNSEASPFNVPANSVRSRFISRMLQLENLNGVVFDDPGLKEKLRAQNKLFGEFRKRQFKSRYCGKIIRRGQDICDWCGHRRDDDEDLFPYPYIFKPPGGGGGFKEGAIVIPVRA